MKTVFSLMIAGLVGTALSAPIGNHKSKLLVVEGPVIEDEYIVVLKDGISAERVAHHMDWLSGIMRTRSETRIETVYDIGTFKGYAGKLSTETLQQVLANPSVKYVEPNGIVTINEDEDISLVTQSNPRSWGLDRIDQNKLPLDKLFHYDSTAGGGVNAYVVDTGVYLNHNDYKGRVTWGANYADSVNDDCNGHGTHVAGTVGGTQYGVAKKVTMVAVKVLNCAGSGSYSGIISGINYVTSKHQSSSNKKTVSNMSLGGSKSTALNDAVDSSSNAGVINVVAAGNEAVDACTRSPASAPSAISVGASSKTDGVASFSNKGSCLELYAPGVDIVSSYIGSTGAEKTLSGTSMASPHVAGVVAAHLSRFGTSTPSAMRTRLQNAAFKNVLSGVPSGTVNYLLNNERP